MSDRAFELTLAILLEMIEQLAEKRLIDVKKILASIAGKAAQRRPGG